MSIVNIKLSDADEGEVEIVITASDVKDDSAALEMASRIKTFIDDLVSEQAKAEATKPSSIIVEHLIACPHCMGAVDLRAAS